MQPKPMVFRRVLFVLACVAFFGLSAGAQQIPSQQGAVPPRITQPVDEANLITLRGNTHPLARPEFDLGPAPANLPLNRMLLVLSRSPEQEAALEALLDQQQDNSSPNYHNWLTPEQFGQQFGPANQDVQAVTSWLETHGFAVSRASKGRVVIEFSGTASQLQEAFHTEIHKYAVNGQDHWANASDPQIPAALAPVVAGVASLNGFPRHPMIHVDGTFSRSKATGKIEPVKPLLTIANGGCGVSGNCYGLGPFDFATVYNISPLWTATTPIDGTGQTIAIVGETDINPQDVASFRTFFGMPAPNLNVIHDGPDPGILTDGEETEADLDVEWSGAVAKGATIDFVVSESTETTYGIDLSAEYIIDNNLAPVMSESYGECELGIGTSGNQFYSQLWQQAAAQGITVFISSGDNGSAGCDDFDAAQRPAPSEYGLQVSGFASTPYNVAVGGTDFNDALNPNLYWNSTNAATTQASAKSYIPEEAWDNTCTNEIFASLGFSASAETNCNNYQLGNFVSTIGGSGGKSACTNSSGQEPSTCSGGYSKPSWQTGTGVPSDGKRDIPDVSLYAAGSGAPSGVGYIVCEVDGTSGSSCDPTNPDTQFFLVGGTSASSPSFAGIMALINQKTGSRQGNANYVFYKIPAQAGASCTSAQSPASACMFYDIPAGSTNAMPCATGSSPTCVTSSPGDSFGVLSGYATTSGYDLATGLGSVNVTNLVNQWSTFAGQFKGTKTTLALTPPATPTHGQPWTVAASVTPQTGSGTPTGSITLIADTGASPSGQDALPQVFQLSNGSLPAGTTTFLPGGTSYKVTAHYSGDRTFGASDSSPVTVTVNPETSKTSVRVVTFDFSSGQVASANASSLPYGSLSLVRADVMNGSGTSCFSSGSSAPAYGCPTGSVALADTGNALGPGPLQLNVEAYTEYQPFQPTVGSHSLTGNYSGDPSYNSSSTTDVVTVTPAPTVTSVQNLQTMVIGTPIVIQVMARTTSVGSYPVSPGGTFTGFDGSTQISSSTSTYDGVIYPAPDSPYVYDTISGNVPTTISAPTGSHTLTFRYSGDANYSPSTSAPTVIDAVYSTQTALTSSSPTIEDGQSVTFTAQVTPSQSAGAPVTGTISFSANSAGIGTATVTGGKAQITTSSLYVGNYPIMATYSGDTNYSTSFGSFLETVNLVPTTTAVSSSNSSVAEGASVTFTAKVTPAQAGIAPMSGYVLFAINGANYVTTVTNNQAQYTTSFSTAGSIPVQASYDGDPNYSSSSASLTETVVPNPTFLIAANSATITVTSPGQSGSTMLTFTAQNGFTGSATLTSAMCSRLPSESTCSFSNPSTVNLTAETTSQTVTLTVMTTAPSSSLTPSARRVTPRAWRGTARVALVCVMCLGLLFFGMRARQGRWKMVLACVVFVAIATFPSCGGGGSSGPPPPPPNLGTPVGNYTGVTVTVTMGGVTQSINTIAVNVE